MGRRRTAFNKNQGVAELLKSSTRPYGDNPKISSPQYAVSKLLLIGINYSLCDKLSIPYNEYLSHSNYSNGP